jgi:cytochrome c oxidase subunit 4
MSEHADQSYERGANSAHHGHGDEHHVGVQFYVGVAVALVFLTACSYWTYTPLWPFGESIVIKRFWMMAVSCTKAMLVVLFFMHLKWEANWKWVLTIPASVMSALLIIALVPDVGRRFKHDWHSGPSRSRVTAAAEFPGGPESVWNNLPAGSGAEHGSTDAGH